MNNHHETVCETHTKLQLFSWIYSRERLHFKPFLVLVKKMSSKHCCSVAQCDTQMWLSKLGFKSSLYHGLAKWPAPSDLTSLSLDVIYDCEKHHFPSFRDVRVKWVNMHKRWFACGSRVSPKGLNTAAWSPYRIWFSDSFIPFLSAIYFPLRLFIFTIFLGLLLLHWKI